MDWAFFLRVCYNVIGGNMKNKKITRKITQGLYVLTTKNGGCIVDAVSQVSAGDNPLIAVSVMKKIILMNYLKITKNLLYRY